MTRGWAGAEDEEPGVDWAEARFPPEKLDVGNEVGLADFGAATGLLSLTPETKQMNEERTNLGK